MTTLDYVLGIISAICLVITAILAWIALFRPTDVRVKFSGVPVDKKDFEKHVEEDFRDHDALHSRIGAAERGVEKRLSDRIKEVDHAGNESRRDLHKEVKDVSLQVASLAADNETNTARLVQMDGKLDRLSERIK